MATIKTKTSSINRNNFDYIRAFAETQSSNSIVVDELVQAYTLISQNMNLDPITLIQQIENGTISDLTLAAQMNSVRAQNALIGVIPTQATPLFISREISA
jgi:hypothetical protein